MLVGMRCVAAQYTRSFLAYSLLAPLLLASVAQADPAAAHDPKAWELLVFERGTASWVRADGGARKAAPELRGIRSGARAKDGRWLIANHLNGNRDIWLLPATGKPGQKRLTKHAAADADPAWTPDGKSLVFASRRDGPWQLYKKPIAGGAAVRLTHADEGARKPVVAPDGKSVAYTSLHPPTRRFEKMRRSDVRVHVFKDSSERVLMPNVHVSELSFSPDGKTLAVSHAAGLDLVDVKSGKARRIDWHAIDPALYAHGAWNLCWHPDSTEIACRISFLGGRHGAVVIRGDHELFFFRPGDKQIKLRAIPMPERVRGAYAWRKVKGTAKESSRKPTAKPTEKPAENSAEPPTPKKPPDR